MSKNNNLKIIFAGTPEFAEVCLKKLIDTNHELCAVYTQPDRPAGRGKKIQASEVKQLALQHHLPIEQPVNFKSEKDVSNLAEYQADVMIVVAYGVILPLTVLELFPYGCINVHASLLPRWRGAAPIQRAIEAGDRTSGISIMQMEKGLDTGPVLAKESCPIGEKETSASLHDKLAHLGAKALVNTLNKLTNDLLTPEPQNHNLATYANKLTKQEAEINWSLPAHTLQKKVRAFNSWPVAFTQANGKRLRIWEAHVEESRDMYTPGTIVSTDKRGIGVMTGEHLLMITELQIEGGRRMSSRDLLNAHNQIFPLGSLLGI